MSKERLHYIDVAKGILIILVVIHHTPMVGQKVGIDCLSSQIISDTSWIYISAFMPAFFVITGYCSNFNTEFKCFLLRNAKTILLPGFTLGTISVWINLISDGCTNWIEYCRIGFRTFILYGGPYWFLTSLFIAKIAYWFINRLSFNYFPRHQSMFIGIISVFLCFLGCFFNGFVSFWWIGHALTMTVFLAYGYNLRLYDKNKYTQFLPCTYFALILFFYIFNDGCIPHITQSYDAHYTEILPVILMGISGTSIILYISKKIISNSLLEYIGKNSLIIYGLHISILLLFFNHLRPVVENQDLCVIMAIIGGILLALFFSKMLSCKILRCLIGKF